MYKIIFGGLVFAISINPCWTKRPATTSNAQKGPLWLASLGQNSNGNHIHKCPGTVALFGHEHNGLFLATSALCAQQIKDMLTANGHAGNKGAAKAQHASGVKKQEGQTNVEAMFRDGERVVVRDAIANPKWNKQADKNDVKVRKNIGLVLVATQTEWRVQNHTDARPAMYTADWIVGKDGKAELKEKEIIDYMWDAEDAIPELYFLVVNETASQPEYFQPTLGSPAYQVLEDGYTSIYGLFVYASAGYDVYALNRYQMGIFKRLADMLVQRNHI